MKRNRALAVLSGLTIMATFGSSASLARASECDTPRPEWLACEDFEAAGQTWEEWFGASSFTECNGCPGGTNDPERILLLDDASAAHDGSGSLYLPATAAGGYRGASLTWRDCQGTKRAGCPLNGHDELYFRTWVRLAADHQYVHHFLSLAGTRPDAYWESDGNAGCRPNGYRSAGTTVDFTTGDADHPLWFYTYFPGMQCESGGYCSGSYAQNICDGCATKDMACDNGLECCWGNAFRPGPEVLLERGRWVCLEMRMQLNTVGQADGEMAFWVDDQLGHLETGMEWRTDATLQLNKAWLQHYIDTGDATRSNRAWFDDMVVSVARIGCGPPPATDGGTPDAGATADAGGDDAGATPDAGSTPDAGDADSGGGTTCGNASGGGTTCNPGCGCQHQGSGGRLPAALLLLSFFGAGLLRRRRRWT